MLVSPAGSRKNSPIAKSHREDDRAGPGAAADLLLLALARPAGICALAEMPSALKPILSDSTSATTPRMTGSAQPAVALGVRTRAARDDLDLALGALAWGRARRPRSCSGVGLRTATAQVETPRIITPSSTAWPPTGRSRGASIGARAERRRWRRLGGAHVTHRIGGRSLTVSSVGGTTGRRRAHVVGLVRLAHDVGRVDLGAHTGRRSRPVHEHACASRPAASEATGRACPPGRRRPQSATSTPVAAARAAVHDLHRVADGLRRPTGVPPIRATTQVGQHAGLPAGRGPALRALISVPSPSYQRKLHPDAVGRRPRPASSTRWR